MSLEYRAYRRSFQTPIRTAHGEWREREGFIVRIQDDEGNVGFGEVAPIPWFGTESLNEAGDYLGTAKSMFARGSRPSSSAKFPCCAFALGAALEMLGKREGIMVPSLPSAELLPAGSRVLESISEGNYPTGTVFKWKIGVFGREEEQAIFREMCRCNPGFRFRLDANGGLHPTDAVSWMNLLENLSDQVEFLEQPLPPHAIKEMITLGRGRSVLIALDESISTLATLQRAELMGWRGVLVLKPAIMGDPKSLRSWRDKSTLERVYSSAFETEVGRSFVAAMAAEDMGRFRPGLGGGSLYRDSQSIEHGAFTRIDQFSNMRDTCIRAWLLSGID